MSSQLKLRRGSTLQHSSFVGAVGEVTVDTDTDTVVVHDGATPGGFPLARSADLAAPSGASLVGYLPAGTAAVATTVQTKLRESVSVFDFMTAAQIADYQAKTLTLDLIGPLQAANDHCELMGLALELPAGHALIKSKFLISCPLIGIAGKTRIVVASDFVPSGGDATEQDIAIKNKNLALTYNAATADYVEIRSVDFETRAGKTLLRLANVKSGVVENCNFTTNTLSAVQSCLDLFACTKNLTVSQSTFDNSVAVSTGGAVWVRNITTAGNESTNDCENIMFDACSFATSTGDEAIAVYGVRGMTRNVTIRKCNVTGNTSAQAHGTLASTFPLNDGYLIGGLSYAAVKDVLWDDCKFTDSNFLNDVLRFGQSVDAAQVCENIKAINCKFDVQQPLVRTSYVMRNIPNVGHGNTATNCYINAESSANVITYGFGAFELVTGCSTAGNITSAAYSCQAVVSNPRLTGAKGTLSCASVQNNRIYASNTGIDCQSTRTFLISDNYVETGGIGVIFNSLGGAVTPSGEISGNTIVMSAAASFAVQTSGAVGRVRVANNRVNGTGKSINGTYAEISGNDWYGVLDSRRAAGYLDYDHNVATPIGTFAVADTHTAGANSYLLGFIKTANAAVAGDWKSVYAGNALT